ncbi:MAG: contractile injection system protein, VgrG/Pvc8 family [Alphaproteobacteria bacterium]|nr:contractile injection system protein, VgrG/Pvc8 family [Alphaproteobacteria bacterium]
MKTFFIALFLLCLTQQVHADDFDTIMTKTDRETASKTTELTVTGFDVPEGYEVNRFSYDKGLSTRQCFDFSLNPKKEAASKFSSDSLSKYLKKKVEVILSSTKKSPLSFSGIITKIAYQAQTGSYSIKACSKIDLLSLHSANKLFVNLSPVEAIKKTLDEHNLNYKFELYDEYPEIEFLTRLSETDTNFINRLMEEVGIFYTNKRIDGKEAYLFVDDITTLAKYSKKINYNELVGTEERGNSRPLPELSIENNLQSDNYRLADYDLLKDKPVSEAANEKTGVNVQEEYQITDYPPALLKKIAQTKLAALNAQTNILQLETTKADIDLGDQIKIGDKTYYVILSQLYVSCRGNTNCTTINSLNLIPTHVRFANRIGTAYPMVQSNMVGFVSDSTKDSHGRIGFRFPWMASQPETVMYRALLSESAKKVEYKNGDKVIITFINGFPDRPIITDKM